MPIIPGMPSIPAHEPKKNNMFNHLHEQLWIGHIKWVEYLFGKLSSFPFLVSCETKLVLSVLHCCAKILFIYQNLVSNSDIWFFFEPRLCTFSQLQSLVAWVVATVIALSFSDDSYCCLKYCQTFSQGGGGGKNKSIYREEFPGWIDLWHISDIF